MNFEGKIALVTGGANGIGRAAVLAFAKCGAKLVVVDRDTRGIDALVAELKASNCEAIAVTADVSVSNDVQRYVNAAVDKFGRIDCFFNNAGIEGKIAPIYEYDDDSFDAVINVNLRGMFLGLRYVLPVMMRQGGGAAVNTASTASLGANTNMVAYVTSKHGVLGLTRAAAADVARHGVRVNAVCPGATETPLLDRARARVEPGNPEAVRERYKAAIPIGRLIQPEEIADMVLFLSSDLSRGITGAHFVVDGGRTAAPGGVTSMVAPQK